MINVGHEQWRICRCRGERENLAGIVECQCISNENFEGTYRAPYMGNNRTDNRSAQNVGINAATFFINCLQKFIIHKIKVNPDKRVRPYYNLKKHIWERAHYSTKVTKPM